MIRIEYTLSPHLQTLPSFDPETSISSSATFLVKDTVTSRFVSYAYIAPLFLVSTCFRFLKFSAFLVCFTCFVPFRLQLPCLSFSFRHLKDFHVFSDFCHRIPAVISSAFWCLVSTPATFLSAQCSYFLFRSAGLARGCGRMALASSVISFALSTP